MNEPWSWTEADLLRIVAANETEDRFIDYKACDSLNKKDDKKKAELAKDVSAFANSAGGTIVYGIKEVAKTLVMDVGYDPAEVPPEWVEQVVMSRVRPSLRGLRVNAVRLSSGRFAYVVHVPQTTNGPHQAPDGKFYKRIERTSDFMQEYEIRDVMSRGTVPDLNAVLAFDDVESTQPMAGRVSGPEHDRMTIFYLKILNRSPAPCHYAHLDVFQPYATWKMRANAEYRTDPVVAVAKVGDRRLRFTRLYRPVMCPPFPPIIENVVCPLPDKYVAYLGRNQLERHLVGWRLRAPGMKERTGWKWLQVNFDQVLFQDCTELVSILQAEQE